MKTKFFLMFASVAMLLAACSKDDIDSGGDDSGVVTDPKGKAWVALDIKTPSTAGTRALHDPNKEDGSSEESTVQTVRAIFFDADEILTDDITLDAVEAGNPGQPSGGVSAPFQVNASSKRILIVANPGAGFPATFTQGTTYADVNKALTISDDVTQNVAADGNFMMSNSKGKLEPSASTTDSTTVDLKLYKTKEQASGSPLSINIDRVVAKVRVYVKEVSDVAVVSDPLWVLNVTNTKFYPVSERTLTWNENSGNVPDSARGTCITPFDQYQIGSYRVDPNYNTADTSDYLVIKNVNDIKNASGSSQYCLENTQTEEYNQYKYTTQVLLKVQFVPKTYRKPDGTEVNASNDQKDWMRINGGFYTFATLKEWIEAEVNSKYNNGSIRPEVTTALTDALNKYLGGVNIGAIDLPPSISSIGELVTLFNNKIDAIKGKGAATVDNFSYYDNGICYYQIMIKHDDNNKAWNKLGEFGVVRNSVYDINVNKFNSPGYPVIPTPGNEPDEEEASYLSVQINVNPWTWYSQEEEF
ncbi:Mfa1 family fimbria major subunit [uncultured Parabacteroides sp.]|uniref:Mfa1 family fimbria major subunit n=1 Tax=uncultured Parabacteroides sp. TaxID=512312 RepID=UPI0025F86528|nr:Mfa1 family fimbria major subunit [uncultured Parabacteroides sp.]